MYANMQSRSKFIIFLQKCLPLLIIGVIIWVYIWESLHPFVGKPVVFTPSCVHYHACTFLKNNTSLAEQSKLFDTLPLVLPSPYSYAYGVDVLPENHTSFLANFFAPLLFVKDFSLSLSYLQEAVMEAPLQALYWDYWSFIRGFARLDAQTKIALNDSVWSLSGVNLIEAQVIAKARFPEVKCSDFPIVSQMEVLLFKDNSLFTIPFLPLGSFGDENLDEAAFTQLQNRCMDWQIPAGYHKVKISIFDN